MFTISSLLILFILTFKFLSSYIKTIRTGDPNETNLTYWMFSYDFKSQNKDWVPEDKKLLQRKRARNFLATCSRQELIKLAPIALSVLKRKWS